MPIFRLFEKSAANEAADRILYTVSGVSRQPQLFGEGRAPDSLDGRFEMMALFASEALLRLKAAPEADRVAHLFVDRLFRFWDAGLREAGVGDLTVPKRMKRMAGAFYGRAAAYGAAESIDDLASALSRNIWNREAEPCGRRLAAYALSVRAALASAPVQALEDPLTWPGAPDPL